MSIFALSDLHLSFSADKSMEVFHGWENYTERIRSNWNRLVTNDDVVVLAGDTSWATDLEETKLDFRFIEELNGKKILLKGNHDYWWTTLRKMNLFLEKNHFQTIQILHNNCIEIGDYCICGTRGWVYDKSGEEDTLIVSRECGRLRTSLQCGVKTGKKILTFLHYPPVFGDEVCQPICDVLHEFQIETVYFGHIHGTGIRYIKKEYEGIHFRLISCDCVDFTPIFVV